MTYITHIFFGFIMAYFGLVPPGMMNMTTVRTAIEKGRPAALKFAAGAATIVTVHAFLAFTFAKYLNANPQIIEKLKVAGIFVFVGLAIFFFMQARKKFKAEGKEEKGNYFMNGFFMSSLNMLGIPFYFGASAVMESKGWISLGTPQNYFLVLGAVLGAFSLFATYAFFADVIVKRAAFIAKNINYVLSGIFVLLAVALIVQLFTA